jgi:hypothetical protein
MNVAFGVNKYGEKYILFYKNFHKAFDRQSNHCLNLISHDRMILFVTAFE